MNHRVLTSRLVLVLACVAGLSLSIGIAPYQVDDAYIFYRYAEHLAAGQGPVFNPSGPAVEGFTSPLWTALLGMGAWCLGRDSLPTLAMTLGILCFLGCLAVIFRLLLTPDDSPPAGNRLAMTALGLAALSPTLVFYAVTGMETLLLVLVVLVFHGALCGRIPRRLGVIASFLATWVRPEAILLPVLGIAQLVADRSDRKMRTAVVRLGIWLLAGTAFLLCLRWLLFAALLPNTFHAKQASLLAGLRYLAGTFSSPWWALTAIVGLLGGIAGQARHRGLLLAALGWTTVAVIEGGDWMPLGRLLAPAHVLFIAASGGLLAGSGPRKMPGPAWISSMARPAAWLLVVAAVVAAGFESGTLPAVANRTLAQHRHGDWVLADWIASSRARSVALVDIGEMGFRLPEVTLVDLAGLTDPVIARAPGGLLAKRFDLDYLFAVRKPDLLVIRLNELPPRDGDVWHPQGGQAMSPVEKSILADPRLEQHYAFQFLLLPPEPRVPLYARAVFRHRSSSLSSEAMSTPSTLSWTVGKQ